MIAKYLEELLKQKEQLANNLRIKGVEADSSETLNTLIPKILQIQGSVCGNACSFPEILLPVRRGRRSAGIRRVLS